MKTKLLSVLYFFIGIVFIVLENRSSFLPGLVVKALIIPVLVILFLVNLRPNKNRFHWLMFAGLFFSWAAVIMSTYVTAQFLIVLGYIKQYREKLQ
jgi:hypothetical protein